MRLPEPFICHRLSFGQGCLLMSQVTEARLVAAVRRGDPAALADLLSRYQHRLYNVCLRMVGNRDDAAEVAQDAMLKVVEHIGDYNGRSAISTWMIRIAMNLSISFLRKRKLRQTVSLNGSNGDGASHGSDDLLASLSSRIGDTRELRPDQSVEQEEMLERLREALDRLEEDFRAVLVLRDLNEMDYAQIAEVLAIPVGTVKSRLFRARLMLRQEMYKLCPSQRPDTPLSAKRGD